MCKVAYAKVSLHVQNSAWATSYCEGCCQLDQASSLSEQGMSLYKSSTPIKMHFMYLVDEHMTCGIVSFTHDSKTVFPFYNDYFLPLFRTCCKLA
jgi:hypothetical protein